MGCHITHNACCEAGLKSLREVVVPALVTDRLTEPRVDVDAWIHPGLPHIRLDFTVVNAEAIHYSSSMRKAPDTAPAAAQAEKTKENKYGKVKRRSWSHRHSYAAQRARTGRTSPKACGSGGRRWMITARVAKAPESCTGQIHCCDDPLDHRAQGLEKSVVSVALLGFSLFVRDRIHSLVNAASKTDRQTDRHTYTQSSHVQHAQHVHHASIDPALIVVS